MILQQGCHSGWIEVICGPMFSGKTEELIRRLKLVQIAKQRVEIFKPVLDNRYDEKHIMSHSEQKFNCQPIEKIQHVLEVIKDNTRVVAIDEAQFFGKELPDVCNRIANRGLRVIVAGLDQDYLGKPFGQMPQLLAVAESVLKLKAVCMSCGGMATQSQRLTTQGETVVVGSGETYEARCRACFDPDLIVENAVPAIPIAKIAEQ